MIKAVLRRELERVERLLSGGKTLQGALRPSRALTAWPVSKLELPLSLSQRTSKPSDFISTKSLAFDASLIQR